MAILFGGGQTLDLNWTTIPKEAFEIYLTGGRALTFGLKTFNALPALNLIYINGTTEVRIEKKSFYYINSSSLLIQIQNCDQLKVKTGAFELVSSSITTEIVNISYVTIEGWAFSKLYSSTFKNVRVLYLYERSFDFKNQGTYGRHGPVTIISFVNVNIPTIPHETFHTSLGGLSFDRCRISSIYPEAFKATQISAVLFSNSHIEEVQEKAFTDITFVLDFRIIKCNITRIHARAVVAGIQNFTVNYSVITEIQPNAVIPKATAQAEIIGNQIVDFKHSGFVFTNWNRIIFNDNIVKQLEYKFIELSVDEDSKSLIELFSFKGNEIYNLDDGALNFLNQVEEKSLLFDDNFFNISCDCNIEQWVEQITNESAKVKLVINTSFCTVNEFLSVCFSLPVGIINIKNFTEKTCVNFTVCEPYEGETRTVDTTSRIFIQEDESVKQNWLIFIIAIVGLFIVAIIATFIVLLIRGSRWLKEKGYFRNNMQYNNNDLSNEEEGTIVTMDEGEGEKLEIPEELTLEFLQMLAQRLDDPNTNQEASEMIERLYEMFIVDDSYDNNRQEEEAHLYEELGNLNLQIPPPPYEEPDETNNGARSILKLMEDKFNQQHDPNSSKAALVSDYSEPSDAAVHLYSELKNKSERIENGAVNSNDNVGTPTEKKSVSIFDLPGPSTKL
nr:unnamed protein product [Callosobruchus analis]